MHKALKHKFRQLSAAETRAKLEITYALTPQKVIYILRAANSGSTQSQAKLATEILEKDPDIGYAVGIRQAAVARVPWDIVPPEGNNSAEALSVAKDIRRAVKDILPHPRTGLSSMSNLILELQSALLPGYAVSQINWKPAGAGINGFGYVAQEHFTFGNSLWPRLVRSGKEAEELSEDGWIVHRHLPRPGDLARGGLVRPLAYLYIFKNMMFKDYLRYLEKFGMPHLAVHADQATIDEMGDNLEDLMENWAADGSAVFPTGVNLNITEASKNSLDVYGLFLNQVRKWVDRLVIGQDSTGSAENSNRSTANVHYQVKHEILEGDCAATEDTINIQVLRPLTYFRHGPQAPVPRLKMRCEPPKDLAEWATIIKTMGEAGHEVEDQEQINKLFGMKFRRTAQNEVAK